MAKIELNFKTVIIIVGCLIAIICVSLINVVTYPWLDEIGTADSAINYVKTGIWNSQVWPYSYNPLHNFLLILWLTLLGVSRLSVCSFNIFSSLLSFIILLNILEKRRLLNRRFDYVLFVSLYWFIALFSDTLVYVGRIDMLVMCLTILAIDAILPSDNNKKKTMRIIITSSLLMFCSIYSIPLMVFFFSGYYIINRDKRLILRRSYFISIISLIVSFAIICLFYLYNHSLIRFLSTFISFNGNISGERSFLGRVFNAYMLDIPAVILFLVDIVILVYFKALKGQVRYYCLFVLLIPCLMVLSGRYRPYYSWLFYIPVVILTVYSFSIIKYSKLIISIFSLCLFVNWCIKISCLYHMNDDKRYCMLNINKFMSKINIPHDENVVFENELFYYFLVDQNVNRWFKYQGLCEKVSPRDKIRAFISSKIENAQNKERYIAYINNIEYCDDYLPQKGYFLLDNQKFDETSMFLNRKGYSLLMMLKDDNYGLYKFEKNNKNRF